LKKRHILFNVIYFIFLQQFFMWLESSTPELSVPYLWSEEKPSSEYFNYFKMIVLVHVIESFLIGWHSLGRSVRVIITCP